MNMFRNTLILTALAALAVGAFAQKPAPPKTKLTAAQATKIALKKYLGKGVGKVAVGKVPLEKEEDGRWEYAVTIRVGKKLNEVMVDANTGKIANVEVTTAKEEAKEAKADAAKMKGVKGGKVIKEEDEENEKGEKGEAAEKGEKEDAPKHKAPAIHTPPAKPKVRSGGH